MCFCKGKISPETVGRRKLWRIRPPLPVLPKQYLYVYYQDSFYRVSMGDLTKHNLPMFFSLDHTLIAVDIL